MAYLTDIQPRVCRVCKKPAKVELHHWQNYELGDYCAKCGAKALAEQKAHEERHPAR